MRLPLAILALSLAPLPGVAQSCPATTTALVLSGGGAKGLAHIGVLRALDSLGLRPDMVVGTSMGAVIGGLYASGYSAREIDSLARNLPLTRLFRTYEPRVPISVGLLQPAVVWEEELGGMAFQQAAVLESEVNAMLNAGFLRGNLTARGQFDSLPIPFRAVATDLLSGEPVVFATGDLAQAIRASAAIPLLFEPEHVDRRYLGDGGLSANVPMAIARGQGAGRLIVSYTTEPRPDSLNLRSTFVLLDHLIGNLFRQPPDSLFPQDIPIRPDVDGFQSLNFSTPAIATLITRGFVAAFEPLRNATCLQKKGSVPPVAAPPVLREVTFDGGSRNDSATIRRLLRLAPGTPVDISRLQRGLRKLGQSDRYSSVWLFPRGTRDSVSFHIRPSLAPSRIVAAGAAYDSDLGGRIWIGQVNRRFLGATELVNAAFLGELRQELYTGFRLTSTIHPTLVPALELRISRERVRRFDDDVESSPLKVYEGTAYAGVDINLPRGWHGSLGVEGRLWEAPNSLGRAAAGPRVTILKAGRMAEPLFQLQAAANADYQRVEMEGIATIRVGRLMIRPRARFGLGESLPEQLKFVFGGVDGFAGRHTGESRSEREVFGSLVLLHPLKGPLLLRIEPMVGATGGASGLLPDGDVIAGFRMGLNLTTGLGPIRVEYGVSEGGREGLLVRLGRWF